MKILSANQIKEVDQYSINNELISSIDLMNNASKMCFKWIIRNKKFKKFPFVILAGNKNNGGDGLSIAKFLYLYGVKVIIYIINFSKNPSKEFLIKKNEINKYGIKTFNIKKDDNFPFIEKNSYLIDSIFGIGLNREIDNYWKSFINFINEIKFLSVISIDVPSGLYIDDNNNFYKKKDIIKANYTLTFQVPKLPFFFPSYDKYLGKWFLINIGWNKKFISEVNSNNFLLEKKKIKKIYKKRNKFSHKGNFGHGIIIGGSYGMIGSVILSGMSCIRSGIGKLSIYTPCCGYKYIQNNVIEAIIESDEENKWIKNISISYNNINAIGIGIGMGKHSDTICAIKNFFTEFYKIKKKLPIVVDADALNILSENMHLLNFFPKGLTILTPHPKEFKRMFGSWKDDYQKIKILKKISKKYEIFIVLKGAYTIISTPFNKLYFNNTGNPGLSTPGSGDVLTGMILSFLSQGYSPEESCIMAVYIHGMSGDFASKKISEESLIARDIINYIGKSFQEIK